MNKKTIIVASIAFINLIIIFVGYHIRPSPLNYDTASVKLDFTLPPNFPVPNAPFGQQQITPAGFQLGRLLFYDRVLSLNNSISCASCHQAAAAFSDENKSLSQGMKQCTGTRNAPALFNLAWQKEYMWDGRIKELQLLSHNAITNPCEIANSMAGAVDKLRLNSNYKIFFKAAFGSTAIDSTKMLNALAQFMTMLVSANSRYDKYTRHENGGIFTDTEKQGYTLFKKNCSVCHQEPLFTDMSYRNNGLDLISRDPGKSSSTHLVSDIGKFRVPSLRNIEVTAPYMHDGRLGTLEEVLDHYTEGIKQHSNLDGELQQNGKIGITLSASERSKIIAFLKTLTDNDFLTDPRFQRP